MWWKFYWRISWSQQQVWIQSGSKQHCWYVRLEYQSSMWLLISLTMLQYLFSSLILTSLPVHIFVPGANCGSNLPISMSSPLYQQPPEIYCNPWFFSTGGSSVVEVSPVVYNKNGFFVYLSVCELSGFLLSLEYMECHRYCDMFLWFFLFWS